MYAWCARAYETQIMTRAITPPVRHLAPRSGRSNFGESREGVQKTRGDLSGTRAGNAIFRGADNKPSPPINDADESRYFRRGSKATPIVPRVSKPRGVVMTSLAFNPVVVVAGSIMPLK